MSRVDIAIIGTGPGGLEAALTARARNKSVLLIGSKSLSDKVSKAHTIMNYLGLPAVAGDEMQKAFLSHVEDAGIEITEDRINTVYAMGQFFMLQGHAANYEATSVILATGVSAAKPLSGELENLGRGVSYCATCDAGLYRGKTAIVVGYSKKEEEEADFLAEMADKVYYLPQYEMEDASALKTGDIEVIKDFAPQEIVKEDDATMVLVSKDGQKVAANGIFILRDNVAPSQLVPGLQIENNHVVVDRKMHTNIPGLTACGDITGAPYQYIKAAGEGNVAALSAVEYIGSLK